ncbi:GNAT family N-acetyltransferase [Roseibium sp. HPY-6]|uniref:GNAT family N-acetyltransferase n=1 Tax=Roseibium sp. HPY-6 TaxID=3229852 RepID=UPI003390174E
MAEIILTTERLRVEPFQESDFPLLFDLHSDPEVNRYLSPGLAPMSAEEVERRLNTYVQHHRDNGLSKWKLLTRDGDFIGRAGLTWMKAPDGFEVGYSLKQAAWGRGYATEIARGLAKWFFEKTDNRFLIAFAHSEHLASLKVMQKAGFTYWFDMERDGVPCTFYRIERHEAV